MNMPRLTEGHRKLERLAGTWQGEETMHPSAWDPKGGKAVGRTTGRLDLNGFALVVDYEQLRDGSRTYAGHGVYTYDPDRDLYSLFWVDSMGSPPQVFTGRFEGDVLTLFHHSPDMHSRMTYDLSEPGAMISRMDMSPDEKEWKTLFDARYTGE